MSTFYHSIFITANECRRNGTICHLNAECRFFNGTKNVTFVNGTFGNGTYKCHCNRGYEGNGTHCKPMEPRCGINESRCHPNAICMPFNGTRMGNETFNRTRMGNMWNNTMNNTFKCVCKKGFVGNGTHCKRKYCSFEYDSLLFLKIEIYLV